MNLISSPFDGLSSSSMKYSTKIAQQTLTECFLGEMLGDNNDVLRPSRLAAGLLGTLEAEEAGHDIPFPLSAAEVIVQCGIGDLLFLLAVQFAFARCVVPVVRLRISNAGRDAYTYR